MLLAARRKNRLRHRLPLPQLPPLKLHPQSPLPLLKPLLLPPRLQLPLPLTLLQTLPRLLLMPLPPLLLALLLKPSHSCLFTTTSLRPVQAHKKTDCSLCNRFFYGRLGFRGNGRAHQGHAVFPSAEI
ncbi:MAG: hypothetical protein U1E74_04835 [Paenacidovorax caeni]